jgi:protein tyrosine phosphatase
MENTVNDFWRMVWDYQSRAIVMLCRMKEDGKVKCLYDLTSMPWVKSNAGVLSRVAGWLYYRRCFVMTFLLLNCLHVQEACSPYLPEHKGDSEVYGKIRVKLVSKETTTDYVIQQLEVSEDKPHPQVHAYSGIAEAVVKVGVFHYVRWPKHGTPRGTAALLELIQHINKTQMTSGNKPITVMCK